MKKEILPEEVPEIVFVKNTAEAIAHAEKRDFDFKVI
jgi:hypothetical protein